MCHPSLLCHATIQDALFLTLDDVQWKARKYFLVRWLEEWKSLKIMQRSLTWAEQGQKWPPPQSTTLLWKLIFLWIPLWFLKIASWVLLYLNCVFIWSLGVGIPCCHVEVRGQPWVSPHHPPCLEARAVQGTWSTAPRGLLVPASHGANTRTVDMYMLAVQAFHGLQGFELRFPCLHSKGFINWAISLSPSFEFLPNYCSMLNNDFPETDGLHYKLMN